jgi:AcrR family transcriptional regulator
MTSTDRRLGRPRKSSPGKREAILRASRQVFGRVGYLGASIDVIATEADVSTRTIYNHFESKEQLFATVLTDSSRQVAAAHEAIIERHLGNGVTAENIETALMKLAREWHKPQPEFAEHFALVGRINAEGEEFPRELLTAWQEAGPLRVQRALAAHMARLAEHGLLHIEDAEFAAQHYAVLVTNTWGRDRTGTREQTQDQTDEIAEAGVRAFLYGHLPRPC